jgi:hypothetical protein
VRGRRIDYRTEWPYANGWVDLTCNGGGIFGLGCWKWPTYHLLEPAGPRQGCLRLETRCPNGCFGFGDDPSPALPGVTQIQAECIRTNESTGQAYFGNRFFLEHDTSNPSQVWFIYLNYTPQDGWKVLQTNETNEMLSGQGWNTGCE